MLEIIVIFVWIICGVTDYGLSVAFYQRNWPSIAYEERIKDRVWAAATALLGPIALFATLITGQYGKGWML